MSNRRRYNWPELIAQFEQSGLSQTQFSKQHDLNAKYFSLKLSKHRSQGPSAFVQAALASEPSSSQGLVVHVGNCKIHCPEAMPVQSFVSLVKALA